MIQFFIQPNSEIPASAQLFDQLSFAITSRAYANGEQLPSIRQLAQWTGLHRNTINKVYQQLKQVGLVTAKGGSGIYAATPKPESQAPAAQIINVAIDRLLSLGYSLCQAQAVFEVEIKQRLRCSAQLLVVVADLGMAEIMATELRQDLQIPVQIMAPEALEAELDAAENALTIITNPVFAETVHKILEAKNSANDSLKNSNSINNSNQLNNFNQLNNLAFRVFVANNYNYSREIARIKNLPTGSSVGLVSISAEILRLAESMIQSIRQDVLIITVLPQDIYRLQSMLKTVDLVVVGHAADLVKAAIVNLDRVRPLEIMYSGNYIAATSIKLLKLELGIDV